MADEKRCYARTAAFGAIDESPQKMYRTKLPLMGTDLMVRTQHSVNKYIQEMVERIVTQFQPEKIILFGSHASGHATVDSDVDLLVVMNVNGSKRQQAVAIDLLLGGIPLPADVIVVTPNDLAAFKDTIGSIIREATHEGKVLYERAA